MDTSRRFKDTPRGHMDTTRCVFGRCFCLSLRAATIIIASLEICIIGLGLFAVIIFEASGQDSETPTSGSVVVVLSGAAQFLVSCLLLHGARKRRAGPMQVWLAVRCVTLMLEVMLWMLREIIDQRFGILGFLTLVFLLTLLNILVVRSYLHNMDEAEDGLADTEDVIKDIVPTQEVSSDVVLTRDVSRAIVPIQEYKGVITRF
ncbi:uncharacterized protein LOC122261688 [Penaeus japonicus]|uniref:uncharacterized protein LOC122261688 n=1 Tax=Penaeus japonicus TaxID=27405 RepID=UPI001C7168F6|nr:uncharacterized protein LOC122261688 [Penaeus japonicus]XP_042885385.1 uncharacterized protein LOC122261688 [Penaeus japonicus]